MSENTDLPHGSSSMETIRDSGYTLILNRTVDDQASVDRLAKELAHGLPDTWLPYHPAGESKNRLFIDNPYSPHFLAKTRTYVTPYTKNSSFRDRRMNSVVNEIAISPKIRKALETPAAINLAAKSGLRPTKFVEPLLGLIDGETGLKTTIYPFVIGDTTWSTLRPHLSAMLDLDYIFRSHGIDSHDLAGRQFMFDTETTGPRLYLLDAEMYGKAKDDKTS